MANWQSIILLYCQTLIFALVWHFCGDNNTKKIEHIQERALRFIYDDDVSNYEQLLEMSKLPSLKIRRLRLMGIQTFKMLNKNSHVYLHSLPPLCCH